MSAIITVGLDLAKNGFQVHGADATGGAVLRKKLRRAQVLEFFEALPSCIVAMEACGGAHHWGREIGKLGHEVAAFLIEWREQPEDGEPPVLVRIFPDEIGVCIRNRGGAPPNLQVLHRRITTSFQKHGYDPSRHLPCIVVHYTSEKGAQGPRQLQPEMV